MTTQPPPDLGPLRELIAAVEALDDACWRGHTAGLPVVQQVKKAATDQAAGLAAIHQLIAPAKVALDAVEQVWQTPAPVCKARSAGTDPPQDCDAPFCGCNPTWTAALDSARESGWLTSDEANALRATLAALSERPGEGEGQPEVKGVTMPKDYPLDNWFTYHAPKGDQAERYQRIREAARTFAGVLVECGAEGPDLTAALRKVREAVMTTNQGIACEG